MQWLIKKTSCHCAEFKHLRDHKFKNKVGICTCAVLCSLVQSCVVLCKQQQKGPHSQWLTRWGGPAAEGAVAKALRLSAGAGRAPCEAPRSFELRQSLLNTKHLFNFVHLFFFFIFFFVHFVHFAHFVHFVYSFLVLCQLSVYVLLFARFIRAVSISQRRKSQEERK